MKSFFALLYLSLMSFSSVSLAGPDCYIGEISYFPYNYTPASYHEADGSEVLVMMNQVLYSVIGNNFGGQKNYSFKLPKIAPLKTVEGVEIKAYICIKGYYPTQD